MRKGGEKENSSPHRCHWQKKKKRRARERPAKYRSGERYQWGVFFPSFLVAFWRCTASFLVPLSVPHFCILNVASYGQIDAPTKFHLDAVPHRLTLPPPLFLSTPLLRVFAAYICRKCGSSHPPFVAQQQQRERERERELYWATALKRSSHLYTTV